MTEKNQEKTQEEKELEQKKKEETIKKVVGVTFFF